MSFDQQLTLRAHQALQHARFPAALAADHRHLGQLELEVARNLQQNTSNPQPASDAMQLLGVPAATAHQLACAKMSCSLLMTGTMTSPSVSEGFERDMLPLLSSWAGTELPLPSRGAPTALQACKRCRPVCQQPAEHEYVKVGLCVPCAGHDLAAVRSHSQLLQRHASGSSRGHAGAQKAVSPPTKHLVLLTLP